MSISHKPFLCLVTACLMSGCSTPALRTTPNLQVIAGDQLPAPERTDLTAQARPYLIGPYDQLTIEVYGASDLNRTVQVDAAGRLSLPLAGAVDAAGKTPLELQNLIEERLRGRYIRDPQVTVNLTQTISQVVTVEGAVEEPGLYPVVGRMTLMRAIARAKGTSEFAQMRHVVVFRRVGGRDMAALYDLRAIQAGNYGDPEIYANDVVVVGESQARRFFRDALQGAGLLTAPIVALIQRP